MPKVDQHFVVGGIACDCAQFSIRCLYGLEQSLSFDGFLAHTQATSLRASILLQVQQHILRRFIWFLSWSRPVMTIFGLAPILTRQTQQIVRLIFVVVTRSVGVKLSVFVLGSPQRNRFMRAPECQVSLGELRVFDGRVCFISHYLEHTAPGSVLRLFPWRWWRRWRI